MAELKGPEGGSLLKDPSSPPLAPPSSDLDHLNLFRIWDFEFIAWSAYFVG
jgi:hypothetical protein